MLWKNTQHSWAGGQLDAELMGRQDLEKYFNGASEIENMSIRRQGNLRKRRGTELVADISSVISGYSCRAFPVVIDSEDGYFVVFGAGGAFLASRQGLRAASGRSTWVQTASNAGGTWNIYFLSGVYDSTIDPNEINYCQIGDELYFAHKDFAPFKIVVGVNRYVNVTAADGTVSSVLTPLEKVTLSFNSSEWSEPGNVTIDNSNMYKGTKSVSTQCTSDAVVTKTINETVYSLADKKKYLYSTIYKWNTTLGWVSAGSASEYAGLPVNTVYYVATYVKDGIESPPSDPVSQDYLAPWQDGDYLKINLTRGNNTAKPDYYKVYKRTGTDYGLIATVKASSSAADDEYVIDDYINPDLSVQPPPTGTAFAAAGDYPSCVGQYQQRLIYASTTNEPFKFWMSAVGDLLTFEPHITLLDSDALSAELAATEAPNINHLCFNRDIVMLTDGGEWRVAAVSGNALTYKTVSATLQSSIGSARNVTPITVGSELLFVERSGQTIRSLGYNFSSDGYETRDLSILAQSIFAGRTIKRMCYRQYPESTIYCVLDDGTIAALVYMKEHDVVGWSHITLGGEYVVQDIACNKSVCDGSSEVMMIARQSNGTYLLRMRNESLTQTIAKQLCLDGMMTLLAANVPSYWQSGWVAVDSANGRVYSSGTGLPSGRTFYCGFPFVSRMISTYPEPRGTGTAQFEVKNARGCEIRVFESGDFNVRSSLVAASAATAIDMGVEASDGVYSLPTKDCRVNLVGANARDGRVVIESSAPTPLNILSLSTVYQIEAEDQESGKQ